MVKDIAIGAEDPGIDSRAGEVGRSVAMARYHHHGFFKAVLLRR